MKKNTDGNDDQKCEYECSQSDLKVVPKNDRAMDQLCCALNGTEFNSVSSCQVPRKFWINRSWHMKE